MKLGKIKVSMQLGPNKISSSKDPFAEHKMFENSYFNSFKRTDFQSNHVAKIIP